MINFFKIALLFLLLPIGLLAQNIDKLDNNYGFKDATFGREFKSFKNMALVEDGKSLKIYRRTSDVLKLGNSTLESIFYIFDNNKLSTIIIRSRGVKNCQALLQALKMQYGPGFQTKKNTNNFDWFGKKVVLSYDEDAATKDATVFMMSRPMASSARKNIR